MKFRNSRGQLSAEFIVILSIVMVIALVAIGLSIFFLQSSGDVVQAESDAYWATQVRPIRIEQMQGYYYSGAPTSGEIAMVLQNVDSKPIYVRNLVLSSYPGSDQFESYYNHSSDGSTNPGSIGTMGPSVSYGSQVNISLNPSEKKTIYIRLDYACADSDPTGGSNSRFYKNLTIYYDTPYFTQLSFLGIKPIQGRCNPV